LARFTVTHFRDRTTFRSGDVGVTNVYTGVPAEDDPEVRKFEKEWGDPEAKPGLTAIEMISLFMARPKGIMRESDLSDLNIHTRRRHWKALTLVVSIFSVKLLN
jgi:hypothetical protein